MNGTWRLVESWANDRPPRRLIIAAHPERLPSQDQFDDVERPRLPAAGEQTPALAIGGRWWLVPLLIAVASRAWGSLLVVVLGSAAWPILVSPPAAGPATMWDGAWYLEIARFGYHAAPFIGGFHDFAFWPAWPALLGGSLRIVPLSPDLVAGLLANGLSIAALVLWARVLERAFGRSTARYGIALVAFSPSAFVLSMGYSEPLFLLLGALFFLSAEGGRDRPLLSAMAQATRLTGFALAAATLPRLWSNRGRDAQAWLTVAAPAVVFTAWWAAIAVLTGSPGGYLEGSPSWLPAPAGGPSSYFVLGGGWLLPVSISAAFLVVMVAGTLVLIRGRRWDLAWYAAAALISSLVLGAWQAMPRYLLVVVPAAAGIMAVLPTFHRRLLLACSIIAEAIYAFFVLGAHFAP